MIEKRDPAKKWVFIVDDHLLVREWLTNLINLQSDLGVCGDADDSEQTLRAFEILKPDAVIVDLTLASGSGIELVKDINRSFSTVAIVVLSMHEETHYAERALRAGARGYVTKREATEKIIPAIREVLAGKLYVSEEFKASMAERYIGGKSGGTPMDQLSDRELEVFRLLGQGVETRRIAETMDISVKTVQAYYVRMKEKLAISNFTELVRDAVRWWESSRNP